MPCGDNGWNCSCKTVVCLILTGWKDIHDDWLPLKNGSLMVMAERARTTSDLDGRVNANNGTVKGLMMGPLSQCTPAVPRGQRQVYPFGRGMQVEPWAHRGGGLCSTSHTDTVSVQRAPFHPNGHWQLQTESDIVEFLLMQPLPVRGLQTVSFNTEDKYKKQISTHYTDEPESMHVPPCPQWT